MNAHIRNVTGSAEIDAGDALPVFHFKTGDGVRVRGTLYEWKKTSDDFQHFMNQDTAIMERYPHAVVNAMLNDQKSPMEHLPGHFSDEMADYQDGEHLFLGDIDEGLQAKAFFKITVVEKFLKMEQDDRINGVCRADRISRSDKKMEAALALIAKQMDAEADGGQAWSQYGTKRERGGHAMPGPRTVRNWLNIFENDTSPLALVEAIGGHRQDNYFTAEESVVLDKFVRNYASGERPTMLSLHTKMVDEIEGLNEHRTLSGEQALRIPSLRTFQNRVNRLGDAFKKLAREGVGRASAQYRALGTAMSIMRPLQRVEMDEWRVDWRTLLTILGVYQKLTREEKLKVRKERVYITAAFDHASRALVGLRVHREAPSIMTALSTLEMVCIDKTSIAQRYGCKDPWNQCGGPETVAADSAAWYANQAFRVTLNDLRAAIFLPPAGAASARGTIERFFRMSSGKALEVFSGRTFGSIEEKGDYDSDALANLPFDEIAACLTRFYVDVYMNTEHEGLNGETPKEAWKRLIKTHKLRPQPTGRRRRHIFGINVYRTLSSAGVRFLGIPYQSPALQALLRRKKQKVLIRVDRFDLGEISAWDGQGWVTVHAPGDDFKGMSIWTWRAAHLELRKLNLEKARMSRAVLRKGRADLEAKGEVRALESGIDSPILTDEKFLLWEKEMDRGIVLVDHGGNVPGSFVTHEVFTSEFYKDLGIDILPPAPTEKSECYQDKGWADPMAVEDDSVSKARKSAIEKANEFNR
ncbi:Mu transposase C-terminal domain-containing protein [Agrobacterium cavarae]|uniref:Mu transposase C-terminal domain-containing protein n=1 Tax=Agrobacterium cavarae TaxID=2528239 RepID=UPI0028AF15F0|nr:Mu transposase C-terminal domain-containing protein [Agrobacterium cavarae]